MTVNKETQEKEKTDHGMLPPISYATEAFNQTLEKAGENWKLTGSILLAIYIMMLFYAFLPAVDLDTGPRVLIVLFPIALPVVFFLVYMAMATILLAFFARDPSVRIGHATFLAALLLFPALIIIMKDTRLLLILGSYFGFTVIVLNLIVTPCVVYKYFPVLLRHSTFCAPVVVLFIAFIYFESSYGFSYERIERQDFSVEACQKQVPRSSTGGRGKSFYTCDIEFEHNGYEYVFKDMVVPGVGRTSIEYMEIRQALFQHFRLR